MDLKLFFSPLPEGVAADIKAYNSFYKSIKVNEGQMPGIKGEDIALIGIEENRGTERNKGVNKAANELRLRLYNLKKGFGRYRIVDLGNLKSGIHLEDTYLRLKEVCQYLIDHDVLPVVIGGSHDMDYGQFLAYQELEKLVSLLNIDATLDMEDGKQLCWSENHIQKIMMHEPNFLFNYSQLGHQTYLIDSAAIDVLEKLYFGAYRLGLLRHNIREMEPVIRDADMLSFDITAIKSIDAPGNANAQAFGLTSEEACQICWYAGLNEKMSSAGFYEYNPEMDLHGKTASVVATMIWYFIEGYYHRKKEKDFKNNDYLKYVVSMPNEPATLVFFKSKLSDKWWLEVPFPEGKERTNKWEFEIHRNCIVPCSYSDYETANKGELPERWINTHAKLV